MFRGKYNFSYSSYPMIKTFHDPITCKNLSPLKVFWVTYCLAVLIATPTAFLPNDHAPFMPLFSNLPVQTSPVSGLWTCSFFCWHRHSTFHTVGQPSASRFQLKLSHPCPSCSHHHPLIPSYLHVSFLALCLHSLARKVHKSSDYARKHVRHIFCKYGFNTLGK